MKRFLHFLLFSVIALHAFTQTVKQVKQAVQLGDTVLIKQWLNEGMDVNRSLDWGERMMHWAVTYERADMVVYLLTHKASVNVADDHLNTPLHLAMSGNHFTIADILIHAGASVKALNDKRESPLWVYISRPGYKITETEPALTTVKLLLDSGAEADFKYKASNKTRTPISCIVIYNRPQLCKLFLEYGADPEQADENNQNLLYKALSHNQRKNALILLDYRVDPNRVAKYTLSTPLHQAVYMDDPLIIKKLVEKGANPNKQDKYGMTALHWAIANGCKEVATYLIEVMDKKSLNLTNKSGETPLHLAARHNHTDLMKLLVKKGVDKHIPDKWGLKPIDYVSDPELKGLLW